jgi:hypothetical protein
MTAAALALLFAVTVGAVPLWRDLPVIPRIRLRAGILLSIGAAAVVVAAWLAVNSGRHTHTDREFAVALSILTSMAAGGPVTKAVLRLADPGSPQTPTGPAQPNLLTGGAWIGALERIAVTTALLAGWPEGLALVLAVKGLGRYPELRSADQPGTAERFIIGTFTSVLWASACAGVGLALLR